MAFTNQQIIDYLLANPELTDPQIVDAMKQFKITPAQMASAVGLSEGAILSRIAKTIPYGSSLILGDTIIVPEYRVIGSGEDQQIGGLETFYTSKTTGDVNYKAPAGSEYQQYAADGTFQRTGKTQKEQSFFGGLVEAFKDPVVLAALGGAYAGGLFGGTGAAAGTAAGTGLGASTSLGTGLTTGAGGLGLSTTGAGLGALGTGAGITTGAGLTGTGILTGSTLGTGLLGTTAGALTGAGILSGSSLGTELLGTGAGTGVTGALSTGVGTGTLGTGALTTGVGTNLGSTVANTAGSTLANTAGTTLANTAGTTLANTAATTLTATELANAAKLGLTAAQYAQLFSSTAQTAAGLLQQQTSKEAADKARAMIDTETAAAKAAAQFRPIGMTTRFGSSQFVVDPLTGRLTSAGYTLSPEAKAAQDRFVKLAETGIQQAEGAQQAFKPLQTGAESLFKLGAGYLAEKPETVAQNYLNQQMALLKPGRELELANLQNKLQQQGRGGLSVAQGGALGATTPELQALFNARAQQEAQLAANAQQYGQQNVLFGAGLLGQGSQAMGQYYGGQQAAYAPYTTAMGQITGLEALGQQPFTMGTGLAQQTAQAGANVGQLGLRGAEQSVALATGRAATTNPYATLLGGFGSSDALGQAVGGLFSGVPATTAMSALPTTFGTGSYYGSQDLGLFL
jgi:hypothetical protein